MKEHFGDISGGCRAQGSPNRPIREKTVKRNE
jgi:hypothetical protein